MQIVAILLLSFIVSGCSSAPKNPWGEMPGPTPGESQSIGKYDSGCLRGGKELKIDPPGLIVMRPSRKRFFGNPALIRFIEEFGRKAEGASVSPVLVGDLGQSRGGPMPSGHASHQSGLDVDIWFMRPLKSWLDKNERETLGAESMIGSDRWTSREDKLLEFAAQASEVERIFVHPTIKRDLCSRFKGRPWIRKIRPWYKHEDHFHVRLACPIDSPNCKAQAAPPDGDGCDETLAWWFSDEAKSEEKKLDEKKREPALPILPEECASLLLE